jgi:hypothetical protein
MSFGSSSNVENTVETQWVSEETRKAQESSYTIEPPNDVVTEHKNSKDITELPATPLEEQLKAQLDFLQKSLDDSQVESNNKQTSYEERIYELSSELTRTQTKTTEAQSKATEAQVETYRLRNEIHGLAEKLDIEREANRQSQRESYEVIKQLEERLLSQSSQTTTSAQQATEHATKVSLTEIELVHKNQMEKLNLWLKYGSRLLLTTAQLGAGYILLQAGLPLMADPSHPKEGYWIMSAACLALIPGSGSVLQGMLSVAYESAQKAKKSSEDGI